MIDHSGLEELFYDELARSFVGLRVDPSVEVRSYLVLLLSDMARRPLDDGPFGRRLLEARSSVELRTIGDGALFLSGFFPERLARQGIPSSYYSSVGSSAYSRLGHAVYGEMAQRFPELQRVLRDVRGSCDAHGLDAPSACVRWLQTRSPVLERRLVSLGVILRDAGEA